MPAPDGFDVLEMLTPLTRAEPHLPVLVLTADSRPESRYRALGLGARDYLTKPLDNAETELRVSNLLEMRRLEVELLRQNNALEQRVQERTRALEQTRLEVLGRLALAAEYRDDNTHEHAQRVGRTAAVLAQVAGLGEEIVDKIRAGAPLHDIGKIGVSDTILLKPARLTTDEFEAMKTHCVIGSQILAGGSSTLLQVSEEIALTHHERWDGTGYPAGLVGDEIPITGRLTAIADVFDALTHKRPYKDAWMIEAACEEIRRVAGTHFDPALVEVFETLDHVPLLGPVEVADPVFEMA
jgi:putative two-component system response regulator